MALSPSTGNHHLHSYAQWLAVSGGCAGLAFAQDCGLGDSPRDARNAGVRSLVHGYRAAQSRCGSRRAFGQGYAVRQRRVSALLKKYGLIGSMSRKGNCWDNAVMERFFSEHEDGASLAKRLREAINDVADYNFGFYNCGRLHSMLGNLSPNAFERESAIQQPIDVSKIT